MRNMGMKPSRRRPKSAQKAVLDKGGYYTDLHSVFKMATGDKNYDFFQSQESAAGITHLASYNLGGKNPLYTSSGMLLAFQMEIHGPDFKRIDYSAGDGTYTVLDAVNKLVNQMKYKVVVNKHTVREGIIKNLMVEPVPVLIKSLATATDTQTAAVSHSTGSIEHKNNEKPGLYLPVKFTGAAETFNFTVELPSQQAGYKIPAELNDHLLVLRALAVEYPKGANVG